MLFPNHGYESASSHISGFVLKALGSLPNNYYTLAINYDQEYIICTSQNLYTIAMIGLSLAAFSFSSTVHK